MGNGYEADRGKHVDEGIAEDAEKFGVKNWKSVDTVRVDWRQKLKEASSHFGRIALVVAEIDEVKKEEELQCLMKRLGTCCKFDTC